MDSEGVSDDDEDDAVSLSAMLDGDDLLESKQSGSELDSGSDSESEQSDEDEDVLAPSDDDDAVQQSDDALNKLDRFIDDLSPAQKRKASELEQDSSASRKRKRRNLIEQNEAGLESEFATRGGHEGPSGYCIETGR